MFYQELQRREFQNPDKISQETIDLAYLIRKALNLPMILLQDAVPPESTSHAQFSLHKWGIDHTLSKKRDRTVISTNSPGRAIDFYFISPGLRPETFLTQYLQILSLPQWGGLGIYPDWRPYPGFHIDTRGPEHQSWRASWIGFKEDDGRQRYLYHPTYRDLARLAQRGFRPNGYKW